VFRKRPTFESDWDMHVLLFFLVPTYQRELNARDKTICASLRNDKLSRGEKSRVGVANGGGVEMYRARVHLSGGGSFEARAGTAHVTRGEGRSSTRSRTRNVKLARNDPGRRRERRVLAAAILHSEEY